MIRILFVCFYNISLISLVCVCVCFFFSFVQLEFVCYTESELWCWCWCICWGKQTRCIQLIDVLVVCKAKSSVICQPKLAYLVCTRLHFSCCSAVFLRSRACLLCNAKPFRLDASMRMHIFLLLLVFFRLLYFSFSHTHLFPSRNYICALLHTASYNLYRVSSTKSARKFGTHRSFMCRPTEIYSWEAVVERGQEKAFTEVSFVHSFIRRCICTCLPYELILHRRRRHRRDRMTKLPECEWLFFPLQCEKCSCARSCIHFVCKNFRFQSLKRLFFSTLKT